METEFDRTVGAIASTWDVWAGVGQALDDQRWRAATRCAGWDVAALYAHVSMFPVVLAGPLPDGDDAPVATGITAVDILRGFNEPGGAAHTMADTVGDAAVRDAATHSRELLVSRFTGRAARRWPGCGSPIRRPRSGGRARTGSPPSPRASGSS